jgi:hypothetical protein
MLRKHVVGMIFVHLVSCALLFSDTSTLDIIPQSLAELATALSFVIVRLLVASSLKKDEISPFQFLRICLERRGAMRLALEPSLG